MRTQSIDTPEEIERRLVAAYQEMGVAGRLAAFVDLEAGIRRFVVARLRKRYGEELSSPELDLRLAALRLDRETMVRLFDWDPEVRGY